MLTLAVTSSSNRQTNHDDGRAAPLEHTTDGAADPGRLGEVARDLVDAGKVVPGLGIDELGRPRSWWWPLPAVGDREQIAGLLTDDSPDAHASTARALAIEVDAEVRRRLAAAGGAVAPRRAGRRTVPQAWLESLGASDPSMPSSLDAAKVAAFTARLDEWIATGAAAASRAHLCLRVHEPLDAATRPDENDPEGWTIELLVQDAEEPSLVTPIAEVWDGQSLFGADAIHDVVAQLGRMTRIAPEMSRLLDDATPMGLALDTETLVVFATERVEALADVGVTVLLPSWWSRRGHPALRAKRRRERRNPTVSSPSPGSVSPTSSRSPGRRHSATAGSPKPISDCSNEPRPPNSTSSDCAVNGCRLTPPRSPR